MAPSGFFSKLVFRPQQSKRKRDGSLPRDANCTTPSNHATVEEEDDEYFTQQPPKSKEDPHFAKRRRGNDPGDETLVDESAAVGDHDIASSFDDLKLRGRVIRRRRAPVSPFMPRKPRRIIKAVARPRRRQMPVFGQASLLSVEEQQLSIAIKTRGGQVIMVENLSGLPKVALDPIISSAERSEKERYDAQAPIQYDKAPPQDDAWHSGREGKKYYDEQTVADSEPQEPPDHGDHDMECVCQSVAEDTNTLVHCDQCEKIYHPICVGKQLQGSALYMDDCREKAMLKDANFYRKNGGFTCSDCDNNALAAKQHWSPDELKAERKRRNKLFSTKYKPKKGETEPHVCDSCSQEIIGKRLECRYCEDFDLCPDCAFDPSVSSQHQHKAGDMRLK